MAEEVKQIQEEETINSEVVEAKPTDLAQDNKNANAQKKDKDKKPKVEKEKTESIAWKCEQFFGKNWKYVASFIGLVMLVNACQIGSIESRMGELEKTVADNNGKVVLTTTDGRAIRVMKEPLKAEFLKQTVVSSLVNNLVVDRRTLTNEFNKMVFNTPQEVLESVPKLGMFFVNFIKQDDQQAVGNMRGYVQWLINSIARDELPEHISIKNYRIDKYTYVGNSFETEVVITAIAQSYLISTNKYVSHSSVMKIQATGTFDLSQSTDENPYGLRYATLQIIPIKKIKRQ